MYRVLEGIDGPRIHRIKVFAKASSSVVNLGIFKAPQAHPQHAALQFNMTTPVQNHRQRGENLLLLAVVIQQKPSRIRAILPLLQSIQIKPPALASSISSLFSHFLNLVGLRPLLTVLLPFRFAPAKLLSPLLIACGRPAPATTGLDPQKAAIPTGPCCSRGCSSLHEYRFPTVPRESPARSHARPTPPISSVSARNPLSPHAKSRTFSSGLTFHLPFGPLLSAASP